MQYLPHGTSKNTMSIQYIFHFFKRATLHEQQIPSSPSSRVNVSILSSECTQDIYTFILFHYYLRWHLMIVRFQIHNVLKMRPIIIRTSLNFKKLC